MDTKHITSYDSFSTASKAVLQFLRDHLGFNLWMVTRTVKEDWIVLETDQADNSYAIKAGDVFRWSDSFCCRMVEGQGPCIAPDSDTVEAYTTAPIAQQIQIGAYIGVPLRYEDGRLFGTLCAIHPEPMTAELLEQNHLIETLARLLCSLLDLELSKVHQTRRAERAEAEAMTDSLTQLYNRRGWDQLMAAEEDRCRQYGYPACVVAVDLDNLKHTNDTLGHAIGDQLLQAAAAALKGATRAKDVVARLGGDEFVVLGVEITPTAAHSMAQRLQAALKSANVSASVGLAMREPGSDLYTAWQQADEAMYAQKRLRKGARLNHRVPAPSPAPEPSPE
jgi:diguanylate cyclase (GGDEF)-like protein